jgi:hypothetical protein
MAERGYVDQLQEAIEALQGANLSTALKENLGDVSLVELQPELDGLLARLPLVLAAAPTVDGQTVREMREVLRQLATALLQMESQTPQDFVVGRPQHITTLRSLLDQYARFEVPFLVRAQEQALRSNLAGPSGVGVEAAKEYLKTEADQILAQVRKKLRQS